MLDSLSLSGALHESGGLFDAITKLQTSTQAVVFLAALGVGALSGWRYRRYAATLKTLNEIPEAQRVALLQTEMGQPLPPNMTPEQFIRFKRNQWIFLLAFAGIVSLSLVALFARGKLIDDHSIRINGNSSNVKIENPK